MIKSLAAILSHSCRPGDFVARYGGEEFVVLYTDCNNEAAAKRADEIRRILSKTPQSWMDQKCVTGSFGVTQLQPGDTPETMLRRADRALLLAKEQGRNRVVQLGVGSATAELEREEESFPGTSEPTIVLKQELFVTAPFRLIIEKLCGFATDHEATVARINRNKMRLTVSKNPVWREPRRETRAVELWIDLEFQELCIAERVEDTTEITRIVATITPRTNRERRGDAEQRAQEVLQSHPCLLHRLSDSPDLRRDCPQDNAPLEPLAGPQGRRVGAAEAVNRRGVNPTSASFHVGLHSRRRGRIFKVQRYARRRRLSSVTPAATTSGTPPAAPTGIG